MDNKFDLEYENITKLLATILSAKPTDEQSSQWLNLVRGCSRQVREAVACAIAVSREHHIM
eukprot:515896-Amphidinium_carterae.1